MSTEDLGKTLGTSIQDKDDMKSELIKPGKLNTRFLFGRYKLRLINKQIIVERQTIPTSGFVLNHSSYGVLGTSTLSGSFGSWTNVETITTTQVYPVEGKTELAKWLGGETAEHPQYLAVGTGNTAYNETQTELDSEVGERKTMDTDVSVQDEIEYTGEFRSTDPKIGATLKEVGIFSSDAYSWNTWIDLDAGTSDPNIDVSNGDIRIG